MFVLSICYSKQRLLTIARTPTCINLFTLQCPCSEKLLAQRLAAVARQMSNASLQQLPEYHQRVKARLVTIYLYSVPLYMSVQLAGLHIACSSCQSTTGASSVLSHWMFVAFWLLCSACPSATFATSKWQQAP